METKIFVNKFLTIGMNDYFCAGNPTSFERHIVECLVDIYGNGELKKAFENGDENLFYNTIMKYCAKPEYYDQFLENCRKFEEHKGEIGENNKIPYASYIEIILIKLFLRKSILNNSSPEEISYFENDLLNNFDIIKWHLINSDNPNRTRLEWNTKKKILSNDVELIELKPEYLDAYTYAKFGVDLDSVKEMDYRMVNELNNYIKKRLMEEQNQEIQENGKTMKLKPTTVISSGNGFVDALMIISIIATEISIGLIYLFYIYRR